MPSSSRRSPLTERVLALATDDWQDIEEFMDRAIPLVPPGRALRAYLREAERQDEFRAEKIRQGKRMGPRKPALSEGDQIRSGGRAVVNGIIANAVEKGWLDTEAVSGNRRKRRLRRSDERRFAHHCCLHGGSCRGGAEEQEEDEPPVEEATPEEDEDAVLTLLIERVLASRAEREAREWVQCPKCQRQCRGQGGLQSHDRAKHDPVREVVPGDIDRLLGECG